MKKILLLYFIHKYTVQNIMRTPFLPLTPEIVLTLYRRPSRDAAATVAVVVVLCHFIFFIYSMQEFKCISRVQDERRSHSRITNKVVLFAQGKFCNKKKLQEKLRKNYLFKNKIYKNYFPVSWLQLNETKN